MKKFILIAIIAACAASAQAAITVTNLFTYGSVSNATQNGSNVLIGTAYIANTPSFSIQSGGMGNTNDMVVYIQYGIGDTTNMTTVATYRQTATNAADGVVSPANITLNIYARAQIVTTNNVNVGTKAIFSRQ